MLKRYHQRRLQSIEYLGGKCNICKSTEDLQLDHINPSDKSFNLAKALSSWSIERIRPELDKCQILCSECHKAKTRKDLAEKFGQREFWEHGTLTGYKYCKCNECKSARAEYMREYRKTHPRKQVRILRGALDKSNKIGPRHILIILSTFTNLYEQILKNSGKFLTKPST